MPSDIYFTYYNSPESYTYLPLAEYSEDLTKSQSGIYNDKLYKLYNEKNEQVGYVTWTGSNMKDSVQSAKNQLVREAATIYLTKNNKLDIKNVTGSATYYNSYIALDNSYLSLDKQKTKALCICTSGSYNLEKIKYITEETVDSKTGKLQITVVYDK
jgi:hypothetical protein